MTFILETKDERGQLKPAVTFDSYRAAVLYGQAHYGYGAFHVQGPDVFVPSREDQLLLPTKTKTKQQILDEL